MAHQRLLSTRAHVLILALVILALLVIGWPR
jgi:hypothetical protein